MTPSDVPPILLRLRHRPLLAALVMPFITARTLDGRYRFDAVDAYRAATGAVPPVVHAASSARGRDAFTASGAGQARWLGPGPGARRDRTSWPSARDLLVPGALPPGGPGAGPGA